MPDEPMAMKRCAQCGERIVGRRADARYCSRACQEKPRGPDKAAVIVRMTPELHKAVRRAAAEEERSVSGLIRLAIKRHLTEHGYGLSQEA